jgi:prepilin-type N-terminal cleavage/methylation domain-containing protein
MKRDFTLIELLVVVAIIGILASLLMPSLERARREAKLAVCKSNQKQFGTAMNIYTVDSDDILAHSTWLNGFGNKVGWLYQGGNKSLPEHVETGAFWELMQTRGIYHCPTDDPNKRKSGTTQMLTSYIMNGLVNHYSGTKYYRITNFSPTWIFMWENHRNGSWNDGTDFVRQGGTKKLTVRHGGETQPSAVTALDGHVETMRNTHFQAELNRDSSRLASCGEGDDSPGHLPSQHK